MIYYLEVGKNRKNNFTIGLLIDSLYDTYQIKLLSGVQDMATMLGYNLICLRGNPENMKHFKSIDKNVMYNLITKNHLDGLIISFATLSNYLSNKNIQDFITKLPNFPVISIGPPFPGIHSLAIDNRQGVRAVISHLIEYHNIRDLAFVTGPEGNYDSELRLQVYKEVLEKYNIPMNPDLIIPGDFWFSGGIKAARILFKEKNVKCRGVFCGNDYSAIGFIKEIGRMGIKVPGDVAVVGFDDVQEGRYLLQPLTTVKQPIYELGVKSVEVMAGLLNNDNLPPVTSIKPGLVTRRSCGCSDFDFIRNKSLPHDDKQKKTHSASQVNDYLIRSIEDILEKYTEDKIKKKFFNQWAIQFCEALNDGYAQGTENNFLAVLVEKIGGGKAKGIDFTDWEKIVMHIIGLFMESGLGFTAAQRDWYKELYYISRDTIRAFSIGLIENNRQENARRFELLNKAGLQLFHTFNFEDMIGVLQMVLKSVGIEICCLSFAPEYMNVDFYKLFIVLANKDLSEKKYEMLYEEYSDFIPVLLKQFEEPFRIIILPINDDDKNYGLIALKIDIQDIITYDLLAIIISNTVRMILLFQQVQLYSEELESMVHLRTIALEDTQAQLVKAAHQAGLAEFSSGILHNVGNIISTAHIASQEIQSIIKKSKMKNLVKVNELLMQHSDNLADYLTNDEQGKLLPDYITQIIPILNREMGELSLLAKKMDEKLDITRSIIITKQDYIRKFLGKEKMDLIQIIKSALAVLKTDFMNFGINVIKNYSEEEGLFIRSHSSGLIQIFINLLKNAGEAVENNSGEKIVEITVINEPDRIYISITDNGVGMGKEDFDRLFTFGYTTKSMGHGFGLNSCKKILDKMGGDISAHSEGKGRGTTFTITLKRE